MTEERYNHLMASEVSLTTAETEAGWHFCYEWDGLLVGPGMGELAPCRCLAPEHPVYKTVPRTEWESDSPPL